MPDTKVTFKSWPIIRPGQKVPTTPTTPKTKTITVKK